MPEFKVSFCLCSARVVHACRWTRCPRHKHISKSIFPPDKRAFVLLQSPRRSETRSSTIENPSPKKRKTRTHQTSHRVSIHSLEERRESLHRPASPFHFRALGSFSSYFTPRSALTTNLMDSLSECIRSNGIGGSRSRHRRANAIE